MRLEPVELDSGRAFKYELRLEGLTDDTLILRYNNKESMLSNITAFSYLFHKLRMLQPETWGNSKGVMSRGEIQLMRLAILCGGISVLTCLVWLLVQLFK